MLEDGTPSDILAWRLTCKDFNQLAERKLIPLDRMKVLNFIGEGECQIGKVGKFLVKDVKGKCMEWSAYNAYDPECDEESKWLVVDRETKQPIGCCILRLHPHENDA